MTDKIQILLSPDKCRYILKAKNIARNSGLITIPPLKLKPFNTGYSNVIGEPIIKTTKGKKIIIAKFVENIGNC